AHAADAADVDLVVMGSRRLGELHAALVGSISRGVITRIDRSVLLVGREGTGISADVSVVLAAVASPDDLEPIMSALDGQGGVHEVVALHVCALTGVYGGAPAYGEPAAEGKRTLDEAVARLRRAGFHA